MGAGMTLAKSTAANVGSTDSTYQAYTDEDINNIGGTVVGYTGSANYLKSNDDQGFHWWYSKKTASADGQYYKVCYAPDNLTAYFYHLGSLKGWVKGYIEGNTIRIPSRQYIGASPDGKDVFLSAVLYDNDNCRFDIQQDIKFTLSDGRDRLTLDTNDDDNLALFTHADDGTVYWGQKDLTLDKFDQQLVTPPSTANKKRYTLSGNYFSDHNVWVATDGDDVYIEGLCYTKPHAWIKGTRDNAGNVTCPNGQYIGLSGNFVYAIWGAEDGIKFNYDAETDDYTLEDGASIGMGYPSDNIDFRESDLKLTHFDLVPGKPMAPDSVIIGSFWPSSEKYFIFDIPEKTVDGNGLDKDFTFWRFYVDDTLFVFTPDRFPVEKPTSEIPATYSTISFTSDHTYYFGKMYAGTVFYAWPDIDTENAAIEIVYDVDGVRNVSDKVYARPEWTAIQQPRTSSREAVPLEYYSIDGRKLSEPCHGLNVVRMSDGTVRKVMR